MLTVIIKKVPLSISYVCENNAVNYLTMAVMMLITNLKKCVKLGTCTSV